MHDRAGGLGAAPARAELMFRDGDSLIVAMVSRSLLAGGPLDWAMSSVLFLPETAVFTALDAILPLDVNGLLAVSAVVNLLALYGAIRLVAGRSREIWQRHWPEMRLAIRGRKFPVPA